MHPGERTQVNALKRPKIADVAKRAGVSEGTVSVVLNNRIGENVRVSEETQQKIWAAVRELGYVANPVAQNLAGGQTHIIAVFTFEAIFPIDSRSFYYPFLIGIEEAADERGYDLLLVTGNNGSTDGSRHIYQKGVNRLHRSDGAILLGHGSRDEIYRLLAEQYPFVFVGKRNSPHDTISYVAADYIAASRHLIEHLIDCGHQRIAYLRSLRNTEATEDREQGVTQTLRESGLIADDQWLWQGSPQQLTAEVVSRYTAAGYTAFAVEDDELGQRLLAIAYELNLQCPDDFSLVVLGNPLNPIMDVPDWTSFNIPRREMGREAFHLLLHLLTRSEDSSLKPLRKILPCTFKEGKTVRRL